ncbi:alkaline phosphatase family protein [Rubinisphaera italica]|uniref:Type I phosphodiesterase / nucleotide pyrophosphatase n=1 Tax=Rubinisphaera italica TaxID=2527969 RepID=A0A5C5XH57_9PLAN|nr:nucleotide pyrophosphatase/phosphodiesterase family protein [Rubinisphaera italica]TWT62018.1 Type I phosphodiesterase / nucleotide pyrophosphatase [Rubinisphaera italica]
MSHRSAALVSIPGLRAQDIAQMPTLSRLAGEGSQIPLVPSFPPVTCPVQISMSTGVDPSEHGVIANGFYWRDKHQVEMWTAWNEVIQAPRIWDRLREHDEELTSAVWFPLLTKGTSSDYACTFAPIHNPDGSESLWCYTKPTELYGELRDELGHFPLKHFWGPLANIKSSAWIIDSAIVAAQKYAPRFYFIYLPHLDYAAQKFGPNSPEAKQALVDLDAELEKLISGFEQAGLKDVLWLFAGEYAITEVDAVSYPNRLLREAGLLTVETKDDGEWIDFANTPAWVLADHQFGHVFVKEAGNIEKVAEVLRADPLIEQVLVGAERASLNLDHERSGEIVIISKPNAWFAYYYWLDDNKAPGFARTIDIHRKPGYDPCEMFINMPSMQTPLDATLVKGSHGYPADSPARETVLISSDASLISGDRIRDVDLAEIVYKNFGIE